MNENNSHCMIRVRHILLAAAFACVTVVSATAGDYDRVARRNFWNLSSNVTGIRADSVTISFAEVHGGASHGDFRDFSQSSKQWDVGAEARTITHFRELSLAGSFTFDHQTAYDMSGSMFIHPNFYPVDVLEFTPGRKDLQTYAFSGGFSADIAPHWRLGAGIEFTAQNYVKRKDLRHTNYRLDMEVSPAVMYYNGNFAIGLNYIFRKNSETASAEVDGSAVANYYAFLDKGLMYGAYELWSGSGVHLDDSGISGFPLSEMSHGGAVQVSVGEFFLEAKYLYGKGKAGEKTAIWYEFPSHRVSALAGYRFRRPRGDHFLRVNFDWFRQYNNENILNNVTENGITLTYVYGSNRVFERTLIAVSPSYEWVGGRTEARAGFDIYSYSRLSSLMYPYMYGQDILSGRVWAMGLVRVGKFDFSLGLSYYDGDLSEKDSVFETNVEAGDPPFQLADYYDLQNEYMTAPRINVSISIRWNLPLGLYLEAAADWTRAFNLKYIDGKNRWNEVLKFGYVF